MELHGNTSIEHIAILGIGTYRSLVSHSFRARSPLLENAAKLSGREQIFYTSTNIVNICPALDDGKLVKRAN